MEAKGKLGLARDELKKSWLKPVGENWCVPLVLEACSPALRSNWEGGEAGKVAGRWLSGWSFPFLLADPTRKVKHNALWGIKEGKTKIKKCKVCPAKGKSADWRGPMRSWWDFYVHFGFGLFFCLFVCFFNNWNCNQPNKAPKTNNMHFMFAPFLYVAAWRIPLTNIKTRTITWSAVIHLKSMQLQTASLSVVSHSRHYSLDLLNPNAANIYILEQTNLNSRIAIRWMHPDHSLTS